MGADMITQVVTLLAAVLAIIWNQQRSTDKLRKESREDNQELRKDNAELRKELREDNQELRREFREDNRELRKDNRELRKDFEQANKELRGDFEQANKELRGDFEQANKELRGDHANLRHAFHGLTNAVADNGQRLARIEGFFGIGMPPRIAAAAAGAAQAPPRQAEPEAPDSD